MTQEEIKHWIDRWSKLPPKRNNMTQEEIKHWIDRWSKLSPSPRRDMTIKIWSKHLKNK